MPAKSRRKRGKSLPPKNRIKDRANTASSSVIPETSQDTEPVSVPGATAHSEKHAVPAQKAQAVYYPYIRSELWTIGALGVLMIIILIILSASI